MIIDEIQAKLNDARRARSNVPFWSAVLARAKGLEKAEAKRALTDENVAALVKKMVKELEETRAAAEQGGRPELAATAVEQAALLGGLIPPELRDVGADELRAAVDEVVAGIPADRRAKAVGEVMRALKQRFGARLDGRAASALVKDALAGRRA